MKIKFVVLFVVLVVLAFVLTSCISVGDVVTAKSDVSLIADWNAPTLVKPVACTLHEDEVVEVVDISTLILGSSYHETIIQVSSQERNCIGWGFPDDFRQ